MVVRDGRLNGQYVDYSYIIDDKYKTGRLMVDRKIDIW